MKFLPARHIWIWIVAILTLSTTAVLNTNTPISHTALLLMILCFCCELMDSSLGMGYGTTLTPILLACGYKPLELVPTILISELLSGFAATFFHSKAGNVSLTRSSLHSKTSLILILGSIIGCWIGVHLAFKLPTHLLKLLIGIIILIAGVFILFRLHRPFIYKKWKILLLSLIASFNKALSGGGYGPLMTSGQILSGVDAKASVAITSFAEAFTCLIGITLFLSKGCSLNIALLIPVCTGALLSVPLSADIVKKIQEKRIKQAVAYLTIILGLFTIIKAL